MRQGVQSKLKHKELHNYGCYLLCLIQTGSCGKDYTEDELIDLYNKFYEAGWIKKDCTVLDPVAIFNSFSPIVATKLRIIRDCKGEKPCYFEPAYNTVIYEMYNPNTGFTHFVLPKWDPLNPERKNAKYYKVKGYRILV